MDEKGSSWHNNDIHTYRSRKPRIVTHPMHDLGEGLLDGVEVGRVRMPEVVKPNVFDLGLAPEPLFRPLVWGSSAKVA